VPSLDDKEEAQWRTMAIGEEGPPPSKENMYGLMLLAAFAVSNSVVPPAAAAAAAAAVAMPERTFLQDLAIASAPGLPTVITFGGIFLYGLKNFESKLLSEVKSDLKSFENKLESELKFLEVKLNSKQDSLGTKLDGLISSFAQKFEMQDAKISNAIQKFKNCDEMIQNRLNKMDWETYSHKGHATQHNVDDEVSNTTKSEQ
jgi:hypothetical protein